MNSFNLLGMLFVFLVWTFASIIGNLVLRLTITNHRSGFYSCLGQFQHQNKENLFLKFCDSILNYLNDFFFIQGSLWP